MIEIKESYDTKYHRLAQTQNLKTPVEILRKGTQDEFGTPIWIKIADARMGIEYVSSSESINDSAVIPEVSYRGVIRKLTGLTPEDRILDYEGNLYKITGLYLYQQFMILDLSLMR